jgi:hypothetical protein
MAITGSSTGGEAMRVIVAGAVAWTDAMAIRRELTKLPAGATVIHGDCQGADALAGQIAAELGLAVEPMAKTADDYTRYARAAWKGLNERMLATGAVLVLAFHPDIENSQGSKHLIDLARAAGIEVRCFAAEIARGTHQGDTSGDNLLRAADELFRDYDAEESTRPRD